MAETREHYVSCHSHWSSWDSLYTLSEDTLGEEMEAWETFQYNSLENKELWSGQAESEEGQCEDCQNNYQVNVTLNRKLEKIEKKQGCLLKIKAELLKQLEERKLQIVGLESSVTSLEREVREKEEMITSLRGGLTRSSKMPRTKLLSSLKVHFQKRSLRSVSMPEELDCVGRSKKGVRSSFVEAIKNRSLKLRTSHKLKEREREQAEQADSEHGQAESGEFQSFTSRCFYLGITILVIMITLGLFSVCKYCCIKPCLRRRDKNRKFTGICSHPSFKANVHFAFSNNTETCKEIVARPERKVELKKKKLSCATCGLPKEGTYNCCLNCGIMV